MQPVVQYGQVNPVVYGVGALRVLGERFAALGCKHILIVCDGGVKAAGLIARVTDVLQQAGLSYSVFDRIVSDPPNTLVDEGGVFAKEQGVDGVLGIGGGSSLDAAKAIAILLTNPGPISRYYTGGNAPGAPVISVPTTAGTGSEVSLFSVITDVDQGKKVNMRTGQSLALLDPELTLTMPQSVTSSTGMDAFAHSFEAVTVRVTNPKSETLGLSAMRRIARYLPIAYDEPQNLTARSEMLIAANYGCAAMSDTGSHIGHSIAYAFGDAFHIPHGVICGLMLPEVFALVAPGVPERIRAILHAMEVPVPADATPEQMGKLGQEALLQLLHRMHFPTLKSYGVTRASLAPVASSIAQDRRLQNLPVAIDEAGVLALLTRILEQA